MATIAENLQTIKDSTDAIKQAIIDKGGTVSGDITTWADAIDNIEASSTPKLQSKNISITSNGDTTVTADSGYDGLSDVVISTNVESGGSSNIKFFSFRGEGCYAYEEGMTWEEWCDSEYGKMALKDGGGTITITAKCMVVYIDGIGTGYLYANGTTEIISSSSVIDTSVTDYSTDTYSNGYE